MLRGLSSAISRSPLTLLHFSYTTEVLEIRADNPTFQVLFIPGNPGVVTFYVDFLEALYELLGGTASLACIVPAVWHILETKKNWERGRLFSLEDQINNKMDFVKQELQNTAVPLLLVGHSICSYIYMEMFKRCPEKVSHSVCCLELYCCALGIVAYITFELIVIALLGKSWSDAAVEAACSHLVKYHTLLNVLFMAMTEFQKLSETAEWSFMRKNQLKIAFLFGSDDHWGPPEIYEESAKQVPGAALSIE